MNLILDNIYTWSVFSKEKQLNFNGWYIVNHQASYGNVVIDPPRPQEKDLHQMQKLGGVQHIIITNQNHLRWSIELSKRFNSKISINHADSAIVNLINDYNFNNGSLLAGFLQAIEIPNNKSPGETALFWKERKILFVGDAMIGDPPGALRLLPEPMYADIVLAMEGLKVLQNLDFDTLLVGDGENILTKAKLAVDQFLKIS